MNLVALLIAPLVVTTADDTGVRIAVGVAAAAILGFMIWFSKSRKAIDLVPDERTPEGAEVSRLAAEATTER
jgi:hypothetical protein